jgi:hypothetical protein
MSRYKNLEVANIEVKGAVSINCISDIPGFKNEVEDYRDISEHVTVTIEPDHLVYMKSTDLDGTPLAGVLLFKQQGFITGPVQISDPVPMTVEKLLRPLRIRHSITSALAGAVGGVFAVLMQRTEALRFPEVMPPEITDAALAFFTFGGAAAVFFYLALTVSSQDVRKSILAKVRPLTFSNFRAQQIGMK